jgi:hypothetical protein
LIQFIKRKLDVNIHNSVVRTFSTFSWRAGRRSCLPTAGEKACPTVLQFFQRRDKIRQRVMTIHWNLNEEAWA